jgi:hypothetical protein
MSRPLAITIPHELGAAEARRRIEDGFGRIEAQFGGGALSQLRKSWDGDRMSFAAKVMGQAISGRIDVREKAVVMEIDLPMLLGLIADRIKGRVQKQGRLLLEKK